VAKHSHFEGVKWGSKVKV